MYTLNIQSGPWFIIISKMIDIFGNIFYCVLLLMRFLRFWLLWTRTYYDTFLISYFEYFSLFQSIYFLSTSIHANTFSNEYIVIRNSVLDYMNGVDHFESTWYIGATRREEAYSGL